ncbi:MAG: hypothetical protein ACI32E_01140 [Bacilli bacterium]
MDYINSSIFFLIVLFDEVRLYLIISSIVILPIFGVVVINILRNNSPISFEIQDDKLVLYKRTGVFSININEIVKVKVNDIYGSFDGCVYTKTGKYPIHYLIKEQRKIFKQFVEAFKSKNIPVEITSVNIGD